MDAGVEKGKHPDWRGHVADAGPHAHHGTRVVIGLQSGTALSLGQDDGRVKDLVELGQIEPPAPEGEALVPQATNVH